MIKKIIVTVAILIGLIAIWYFGSNNTTQLGVESTISGSSVSLPEITGTIKEQIMAHSEYILYELHEQLGLDIVKIKREDCNEENAFYHPDTQSITICNEMIDGLTEYGKKESEDVKIQQEIAVNSTLFFLMHELGHAYIDLYKLPITGKEEDVADQIATYLILKLYKDRSFDWITDGAFSFYEYSQQSGEIDDNLLSDVHSLDKQRFFNIACWLYGSTNDQEIITNWLLPQERADGCIDEYNLMKNSLDTLLTAPTSKP